MYLNQSIKKYLDDAAAKLPAPGGGSVAAAAGALAASMISMVANFTVDKKGYEDVREKIKDILKSSEGLRIEFEALIDKDVEAYGRVSAAYKLPKETSEQKEEKQNAIKKACKEAMRVPITIAKQSIQVLKLAGRVKSIGNKNLISDVGVAAVLAYGAYEAGVLNILINMGVVGDDSPVSKKDIEKWTEEAKGIKEEVCAFVAKKIG
jgi:formiminotetrahydrofolate cyclodeaminase